MSAVEEKECTNNEVEYFEIITAKSDANKERSSISRSQEEHKFCKITLSQELNKCNLSKNSKFLNTKDGQIALETTNKELGSEIQMSEMSAVTFPSLYKNGMTCLPASKGSIKKTAQTRFVNSSPRSYRLMPASIESSDRTSFIEKFPHRLELRVSYMLAVADLWKISTRSELECKFTSARATDDKGMIWSSSKRKLNSNDRPISHSFIRPPKIHCPWTVTSSSTSPSSSRMNMEKEEMDIGLQSASLGLDRDLLKDVKRFLKSHYLNQTHPMGIAGFLKPCNTEQSDPKNFVTKTVSASCSTTQSSTLHPNIAPPHHAATPDMYKNIDDETTKCKQTISMEFHTNYESQSAGMSSENSDRSTYECFYCEKTYSDKNLCAQHMQEHLTT